MVDTTSVATAPIIAHDLTMTDLCDALIAGLRDFLAHPLYGLCFGATYAGAGLIVAYALFYRGEAGWLVPLAAGFPVVAPFAAVGLYEISRRRQRGLPLTLRSVLGAMLGRGDEQLLMMGGFIFVAFSFWVIIAHSIFSIFMAESGVGGESLAVFQTQAGIWMLVVGTAVGAVMAWGFYTITVISLPMLVDRDVDFITAIIASVKTVRSNPGVMLTWAAIIAISLSLAMLPLFLGLLAILPVLGHATWHLYQRAVR